jgi:hypothetical protein
MDAIVLVNWACLAVTLVVIEIFLRWPEIALAGNRRRRRTEGESAAMNGGALAPTSPTD